MRLNDILDESVLNELSYSQTGAGANNSSAKPQNFLSRVKTGIASKLHPDANVRRRATGIQGAGKQANKLMGDYQEWLGRKMYDGPTKENLIAWMTSQRLPIDGRVKLALDKITPPTPAAAAAQPTDTTSPADDNAAAGSQAFNNMAGGLDKMANKPAVTTSAPGTKGGLGPKGRGTLARLGQQSQDRENPKQGTLGLNEDDGSAETPLTNQQVSDILSTAVADMGTTSATPGAAPTSAAPSVTPGAAPAGNAPTAPAGQRTPSAASAPKMTIASVAQFYSKLDATGKQQLRQALDNIDKPAADDTAKLTPDEYIRKIGAEPTPESTVGFSRFLGMKL